MKTGKERKLVYYNYIWYFMIFCIGIVFLLVFSISTSPLTSNSYGSDSAFFQMVGQSMTKGQFIYCDIFDNKGPYLFLIQYLGQILIYGRYGIFLIQVFNLCITLFLVDRICRIVCGQEALWLRFFSICAFIYMLGLTLDGGNLSEEYSLSVLFLCLYSFFRFLYNNKKNAFSFSVIFGASFGFLAFMRITNAGFICILIAALLIDLILEKRFRIIFNCMAGFITGFLLVSIPVCVYCAYKGVFSEMLYATFVFNYIYGTRSAGRIRYAEIIVLFVTGGSSVWINRHERMYAVFSVLSVAGTVGILLLGHAYIHYYQLIIPPVLANIWLVMRKYNVSRLRHKKLYLGMIILLIFLINSNMLLYQGLKAAYALGMNTPKAENTILGDFAHIIEERYTAGWWENYGYKAAEQVSDILERIPADEYSDIYNYNTRPYWLRVSGLLPYNKYCQTQESFIYINPRIKDEIDMMFEQDPPKYIVMEDYEGIRNDKMLKRLEEQYFIKYQNKVYILYERI